MAKSDTRGTGKRWLAAKPKVVITVATTRVYFDHGNQAVELARAVVVARNGEHALVESHDDEADEHGQTVANAVSPHSRVAAVALHREHQ